MRKRPGIDDDTVRPRPRRMQGINQRALVVRLLDAQFDAFAARDTLKHAVNVGERLFAIDFRFAHSEQIEVRSVQDEDVHGEFSICDFGFTIIELKNRRTIAAVNYTSV